MLWCSVFACLFWICISCLLQKKDMQNRASQQTFGCSYFVRALAIPNFDQIFPHWWSHIISYNKTLIGLKFYREIHTVLQCFRYSKTNTIPIVKFWFWIRQIIILLVAFFYKSECLNGQLYFSTANICQLQICKNQTWRLCFWQDSSDANVACHILSGKLDFFLFNKPSLTPF